MALREYSYLHKTWVPEPTYSDGNCFFHAIFGERAEQDDRTFYFDRNYTFRRMFWAAFLIFFQNEDMPSSLLQTLHNCFIANDTFTNKSPSDPDDYSEYIRHVALGQYWVSVEEIPILSSLWNVKVVLFLGQRDEPNIFAPDHSMLGEFPFSCTMPLREAVIRLSDHHFEKLTSASELSTPLQLTLVERGTELDIDFDSDEEILHTKYAGKTTYKKGGSAGVQGGLYQIKVLTMILLNAMKKMKVWLLSTENKEAGKFDDIVLESVDGDMLLQAKHKESRNNISYEALLSSASSNFSLAKYFFSYLEIKAGFNITNVVICTNGSLHAKKKPLRDHVELKTVEAHSVLHFKGAGNQFYVFKESILPALKESIEKFAMIDKPEVHDEDIKVFLGFLKIFVNFATENDTKIIIDELIPTITLAKDLKCQESFEKVNETVKHWFYDTKGRYFTRLRAKTVFCEIRSKNYSETFLRYNISFKINLKWLTSNANKKIFHIIPTCNSKLHIIKIYQRLKNDKALFVNPNDDLVIQSEFVKVFSVPTYVFLVISLIASEDESFLVSMCNKLKKIINEFNYKKIVVVAEEKNKLAQMLREINDGAYEEIPQNIKIQDLEEASQVHLKQRTILFQGNNITVENLVGAELDDFADANILEKLARSDMIQMGATLKHVDENLESYYIYRSLKHKELHIPEENIPSLTDINDRIILISDSAGMGKTTILTNLAIKIKEHHPHLWVVRIDLNNYSNIFRMAIKTKLKTITVQDLLNDSEVETEFARKLFLKPSNAVLMLDAVDEVSAAHMDLVMRMIGEAKVQENFLKIFVTTRPHLCEELEERLEVTACTLEPFSSENQEDFLTNYWTQKLSLDNEAIKEKCRKYARALINEMSRWIDERSENTFAGIPLQTRMLAEVFQEKNQWDEEDNIERQWEECEEFLYSDEEEPQLPKKINLIQLYQLFVAKKRDIFINEKGKTEGNSLSEQALKDKFKECDKYHHNLALAIIFYTEECRLFTCFRSWDEFSEDFVDDYVLRAGIIQRVDGKQNFIHRTFAEYFAAECLVLELKEGCPSDNFQELLLEEVLIREEYFVVRAFFDSFVQKEMERIPDATLLAYSTIDYITVLNHSRNSYFHLFAQEGLVGTLEFLIACINFGISEERELDEDKAILLDIMDMECNTPLHDACLYGHLHVVVALVKRGANVNVVNAAGDTPLHLAACKAHFDVVQYIVNQNERDLHKINTYGESLLHAAVQGGNLKTVQLLVESGVDPSGTYLSALHVAASIGHLDIVKYLVEEVDFDIEHLDVDGCTSLHAACHQGHLDVVDYLIEKGSNVNALTGQGSSAYHDTALRGYFNIVQSLLDNGGDVNFVDADGYTIRDLLEYFHDQAVGNSDDDESDDGNDKSGDDGDKSDETSDDNEDGGSGDEETDKNEGSDSSDERTMENAVKVDIFKKMVVKEND